MKLLIEAIGFGIATGAVIALGAVGFSVQFGISNVLNITYGSMMTLAAFVGYAFLQLNLNVWLVMAVTSVIVAVASVVFNRLLLEPLKRRGTSFVGVIIATVSAGIVLQYVIVAFVGATAHSFGQQSGRTVSALDFVFTTSQLIIIGTTVVLMVGLHVLLTGTKIGRAMRATSTNRTVARACGIRTERIIDFTWLLSGALCGAAGVALAITTVSFDFTLGSSFLIYMIAAAVLGGIGQPYGAMVGGLVVGIASQIAGAYWSPAYQDVIAFVILIIMLLVRPRGLFSTGTANRRLANA
ncbi:MAG: branched-chain amino acid ABC transporter permease [Actinomycetota bacterium]|nr:branched-chain amino acid ABC transporter permease [Actinomycetota bacterium]